MAVVLAAAERMAIIITHAVEEVLGMAEYSSNAIQTVAPGAAVVFTETGNCCRRGFIRHTEGSGTFTLSGWMPYNGGCRCNQANNATYTVYFSANIAVPTGGTTPATISLAISENGDTVPSTTMDYYATAVDAYGNVSVAKEVPVWNGCCATVSIRNTSAVPINVQNANVIIRRDDLNISR